MQRLVEVRRLLHVNYNCVDVELLERWYRELFEMDVVMRSDAVDADGTPFGLQMANSHLAVFLYDHRGARRASALELVQWRVPPTIGRPYPHPWDHGIQALAFSAPDLDAVARKAVAEGGAVARRTPEALLLRDPEGLPVEVHASQTGPPEKRHLRVVVRDLARSLDWWSALGFGRADEPAPTPAGALFDGGGDHAVEDEVALTPRDDTSFALRFTTWSGPPPTGPTYGAPFHQGLYRIAMAVDDAFAAWESLRATGIASQPPTTFPLPGTKIREGLTILFVRDPDGILVELVERSPRHFRS